MLMHSWNPEADSVILLLGAVLTIVFICIVFAGRVTGECYRRCSPLARHRIEKEKVTRRKIDEYKARQAMATMGGGAMDYKVYECCYKCHGDGGCGIAELHLALSPAVGTDGCRSITGCGIRGEEFTEITDGHIERSGKAEFIEQTITTREISTHQSNEGQVVPEHTEPVYIRSEGKFNNTEPVYVASCLYLNFEGELLGGNSPARMQRIGEYVSFQLKEKSRELRQREQYTKRRHDRPAPIKRPDGSTVQRIDFETVDDIYGDPEWQAIERDCLSILSAKMTPVKWKIFCNEVDRVLAEGRANSEKTMAIWNTIGGGLSVVVFVLSLLFFGPDGFLLFLSFYVIGNVLGRGVSALAAQYVTTKVDGVLADESRRLLGVTFHLRHQRRECKSRMTNGKRPTKAFYYHHYIDCILDDAAFVGDCNYLPPSIV